MPVSFQFELDKAVAAVAYLASRGIPELDKYKIAKLIFLADKAHLVRFGRPITGDKMWALKHGPVPSRILDLLDSAVADPDNPLSDWVELSTKYSYRRFSSTSFDQEALSASDIVVLDEVIEKHGGKSFHELKSLTHEMLEWQAAWARRGSSERADIFFEDIMFEEEADAIEGAREAMEEDAEIRLLFAS